MGASPIDGSTNLTSGTTNGGRPAGQAIFDMTGQTDITVGGRYENGDFTKVFGADPSWSSSPADWSAEGEANAKIYLRAEISILIFHVAGPYLDAAPYLDFEGQVMSNPFCWEYGIYAGLEANTGLELDIFVTSKKFNIELFDIRRRITGDQDCPPSLLTVVPLQGLNFGDFLAPTDNCGDWTINECDPGNLSEITQSNSVDVDPLDHSRGLFIIQGKPLTNVTYDITVIADHANANLTLSRIMTCPKSPQKFDGNGVLRVEVGGAMKFCPGLATAFYADAVIRLTAYSDQGDTAWGNIGSTVIVSNPLGGRHTRH